MVDVNEIKRMLDERGVSYTISHHKRVYSIAEMEDVDIPNKDKISKNIVLTDDKKRSFYLISLRHDKKLDLKELRKALNSRPLSFLAPDKMEELIAIKKGEVTPFALLNDESHLLTFIIDESFMGEIIGIHPNDNSLTLFLKAEELVSLLKERGEDVKVMDLPYQE